MFDFATAVGLSVVLIALVMAVHYQAIRWLAITLHRRSIRAVRTTVAALFVTHIVEILLFAAGIYAAERWLKIGSLTGVVTGDLRDYVYFSMVTYTSLGYGDIFPLGEMRLIAGLEALTGLLMIGWSASFLFVEMRALADAGLVQSRPRHPAQGDGGGRER